MMRAEFFVFHYGMAFLEALYAVKEDLGLASTSVGPRDTATPDVIARTLTSEWC